ncbi:GNAT family N-acetyltransferase [Veronia pacifica]|uniref:Acetyltransferase n=1 Tax=Veronia pacifica TaxID=1080227 RepID=A0A1C3EKX5_9GAMM|nr:GNAT family protein [Veronia pacifica]ODA33875.1 acetyltransferase [Veronia pacifica]
MQLPQDISLRPLEIEDTDAFYRWFSEPDIVRYSLSGFQYPRSKSDIVAWLRESNKEDKTVNFGITAAGSDEVIGYAGITSISTINRSGEYFILIGERDSWGKGIGTIVTKKVIEYGFCSLGLHRIELTAFSTNIGAIKAYENAGFHHEGVKRQAGFRDGEFIDKVQMSILATEWPHSTERSPNV